MRLIDADKISYERAHLIYPDGSECLGYRAVASSAEINAAPTVDAVEVVRCKDCQKCLIDNSKMELHLCMKRPSFPVRVKLDGFCSYGERKDGDRNG